MTDIKHPIDWLKATRTQRAKLYPVAHAVREKLNLRDWNAFLSVALSKRQDYSPAFDGNFRRGRISQQLSLQIYNWIAANHLDIGQRLAKDLFPTSKLNAWDQLVAGHGMYGFLKIINPNSFALTRRSDDGIEIEDEPVFLKQPYCFALYHRPKGDVILIERHEGGDWFPVPIGSTAKDLVASIRADKAVLPWDAVNHCPISLREHIDTGLREFILVHGGEALLSAIEQRLTLNEVVPFTTLNDIAAECVAAENDFIGLHRLNIVFKERGGDLSVKSLRTD